MVNTKTRLTHSLQSKMVNFYSQQKQDKELTVAQIMNCLLQNSDLNGESRETTRTIRYDLNQIPYDYTV